MSHVNTVGGGSPRTEKTIQFLDGVNQMLMYNRIYSYTLHMYIIMTLLASSRSSQNIQKLAAAVDCKSPNLRQIQRVTDACTAFAFGCGRL